MYHTLGSLLRWWCLVFFGSLHIVNIDRPRHPRITLQDFPLVPRHLLVRQRELFLGVRRLDESRVLIILTVTMPSLVAVTEFVVLLLVV